MIKTHKTGISTPRVAMLTLCATAFCYFIVSSEQVVAQQQKPAQQEVSPSQEVMEVVDEMPAYYNNGIQGLYSFLGDNIKYPADERKGNVEGTVFISFVVEKDGNVSEVKVQKGVSKGLDAEALRVARLTRWTPGKTGGKIVRTRMVLPIQYKLGA